jgi:hypothetical protein
MYLLHAQMTPTLPPLPLLPPKSPPLLLLLLLLLPNAASLIPKPVS